MWKIVFGFITINMDYKTVVGRKNKTKKTIVKKKPKKQYIERAGSSIIGNSNTVQKAYYKKCQIPQT